MVRKILKIGFIIILIGGVAYSLTITLIFSSDVNNYLNRQDFNKEQWVSWEESETELSLRWDMIISLEKNFTLVGMKKTEILDLLGPPDYEPRHGLIYNLGATRRGVNYGTLDIQIQEGIVISYEVIDS